MSKDGRRTTYSRNHVPETVIRVKTGICAPTWCYRETISARRCSSITWDIFGDVSQISANLGQFLFVPGGGLQLFLQHTVDQCAAETRRGANRAAEELIGWPTSHAFCHSLAPISFTHTHTHTQWKNKILTAYCTTTLSNTFIRLHNDIDILAYRQ